MILDNPLKRRDDIQQLNKEPIPKTNGNPDSKTAHEIKDANNPTQPMKRKISPAKVNDSEIFFSFFTYDNSLSSSKRFSNP